MQQDSQDTSAGTSSIDPAVQQLLKNLPVTICSASFKQRKHLFQQLQAAIPTIGDSKTSTTACKFIFRSLTSTIHRYNDSGSRRLVVNLIRTLIQAYPNDAPELLVINVHSIALPFASYVVSPAHDEIANVLLNWLNQFSSKSALSLSDAGKKALVESHISLCSSTNISKKLHLFWSNKMEIANYIDLLRKYSQETIGYAILWAEVVNYLQLKGKKNLLEGTKVTAIEAVMRLIVSSKVPVDISRLRQCRSLFHCVTHDDFKQIILPSLNRAALRTPEVSLHMFPLILDYLRIDLSEYASELGKLIGTSLHSKEDSIRDSAVEASKSLVKQCSNSSAIEHLIDHYFKVYNGSEGKLTVLDHRLSLLSGIGALSHHGVTGASPCHDLALLAIDNLVQSLKNEVAEGIMVQIASQMHLWASKLTCYPPSIISWFKASLTNKVVTTTVRSCFIAVLIPVLKENLVATSEMNELLTCLVPIASKNVHALITQTPSLVEGMNSALFVLSALQLDSTLTNKCKGAIDSLMDTSKVTFFTPKFLQTASNENLVTVATILSHLLVYFEDKLKSKQELVLALAHLLTNKSYQVRQKALVVAKSVVNSCTPAVITSLISNVSDLSTIDYESGMDLKPTDEQENAVGSLFSVSGATLALKQIATFAVTSPTSTQDLVQSVLMESFKPCHAAVIYEQNKRLWLDILHICLKEPSKIDAFISQKAKDIIEILKKTGNPVLRGNCIAFLVQFFPQYFIVNLINSIISVLENASLSNVTKEEYNIFITPEGVLFNTAILDQYREVESKNIKRENKAYSYKEQLAEMALRQELGKVKEPQLSKKQLEVQASELQNEAAVRNRIRELHCLFSNANTNLLAIVTGNPYAFACEFGVLIDSMIHLLSSPLCASKVASSLLTIGKVLFKWDPQLLPYVDLIHACTLRQVHASMDMDEAWMKEPLDKAVKKLIRHLARATVPPAQDEETANGDVQDATNHMTARLLTAPAFAYTFPLVSRVLSIKKQDEEVLRDALAFVSAHVSMREDALLDTQDEIELERNTLCHPKYLPKYSLFNDLLFLMRTVPLHIEGLLLIILKSLAESCRGGEEYATLTENELSCILNFLKDEKECVRFAAISCLTVLGDSLKCSPSAEVTHRIFVAQFDPSEKVSSLAVDLWKLCHFVPTANLCYSVIKDIPEAGSKLRTSLARAMHHLLETFPDEKASVFNKLIDLYKRNNKLKAPELDSFGRPIQETQKDNFTPRLGVATVLRQIVPLASGDQLEKLTSFFVPHALNDRNESVQLAMLESAVTFVNAHGASNVAMLDTLQSFMEKTTPSKENDAVRRNVIILLGTLARYLDQEDPRIKPIVSKLIEALSTPSQIVQEAVANCLPHLVPAFKDEAPTIIGNLIQLLLQSELYGERRGAAYGIAGLVKGLGIMSLKAHGIMEKLTRAIQNKKSPGYREGALFAFQMLTLMLGKLFEPYIITIVPNLLLCYGDASPKVRSAADETAKCIMSRLSAHGVKLVLPSLLEAIDVDVWRTKVGAIELLGSMSHCAPKQLSSCLPMIVPKLMDVVTDSHPKVREAGADALRKIGSVIRNPEIQAIVPVLLEALQNPSDKTKKCLQKMLNTKFVHFIDAPSLALIMPVIERAFRDRSTETRKMAAQIIGNMYSLTDHKDLSPYLPSIIPGLKASLIDPVPEVRSVTARALGAMVKGMGEEITEQLVPWLMETLITEASSVDRAGAAQGLAEVIGGLGIEKLHSFMPQVIATAEQTEIAPHVRDGYIMLFIYLPIVFNQDFVPYIGKIITPILKALADENEFVRETALRAGQRMVNMYADSAIQLLLPQLEDGLFDENWRIRLSSVQLLGDLLYKISGVSGKMTTETVDEDDNFGTEQSYTAIIGVLGLERRNRVLSGLYMGRSDVSLAVRQASLHVWKVVVTNTPRTLKEILPTLFGLLLGCLASSSEDKQQVAARTLGDLVRKLGERVLPEIIPILEQGLKSDRADQRQGVCIGLSEIVASTSREMVQAFAESLVPTVTRALYDPLPEVRTAAAKTFDSLHSAVGSKLLDEMLPKLLELLSHPEHGEDTLDGLRQIMAIKGRVVLPYLVPQLTATPANTRALSQLASVASADALSKHLNKILPALLLSLANKLETDEEKKELEYCQAVILAVNDEQGVRVIVDYLLDSSKSDNPPIRRAAVWLILSFSSQSRAVASGQYVSQILRGLISLMTDSDEVVLTTAWDAINCIVKNLDTKGQMKLASDVRSSVRYASSDYRSATSGKQGVRQVVQTGPPAILPGFSLAKGIGPILPIFREALLNGSPDQKELAAQTLSEIITISSPEALKSSVINMAGPLIRILGDRFAWTVKVAVLDTLSLLLEKVGSLLRPFLPQLQQTFLKSLADSQKQVRLRSANALSHLAKVHSRCDPLFQEILSLVKNDDVAIRETALYALRVVVLPAGDKASESVMKSVTSTVTCLLGTNEDQNRTHAASCLGTLCKWLPEDDLKQISKQYLLVTSETSTGDWMYLHGCSIALRIALKETPDRLISLTESNDLVSKSLMHLITSDRVPLVISGLKGSAYFLQFLIRNNLPLGQQLLTAFARVSLQPLVTYLN